MERISMSSTLSRGAAAALVLCGMAIGADAQGVAPARVRDSIFVRQLSPGGARIDSVMLLFGVLQRESPGSNEWVILRSKIDSLLPGLTRMRMPGPNGALPKGWIGINAGGVPVRERITEAGDVVRYLGYPEIVSVDPESPASRAGIVPGDLVIAYNGIDVVDHDMNLTRLFIPEKRMSVTVRRDGEIKEFAVQIAKMPEHVIRRRLDFDGVMAAHGGKTEIHIGGDDPRADDSRIVMLREGTLPRMPMPGRMYVFAPDGIFGARVSPVTPELARVLKLETGVLINDVADESPAAKSGLHAGDVIVGAEGQSIATLNELQRVIAAHLSARAVELQVVREKKPRKLTVSW